VRILLLLDRTEVFHLLNCADVLVW